MTEHAKIDKHRTFRRIRLPKAVPFTTTLTYSYILLKSRRA